jgi:hypothetical protein
LHPLALQTVAAQETILEAVVVLAALVMAGATAGHPHRSIAGITAAAVLVVTPVLAAILTARPLPVLQVQVAGAVLVVTATLPVTAAQAAAVLEYLDKALTEQQAQELPHQLGGAVEAEVLLGPALSLRRGMVLMGVDMVAAVALPIMATIIRVATVLLALSE